jgi:predicted glycoside hydrolase/deacetylase ChbG (UPF0249 family)
LIFNADDFGLSERVTEAILEAHRDGVVTSTTTTANMPAVEYAARCATECPKLGVGVHLNLTEGFPLSAPQAVPDLVTADGRFRGPTDQPRGLVRGRDALPQVEAEFAAQVGRLVDLGVRPTHLDSHHHICRMPVAMRAMVRVARAFGIDAVRTNTGYFWTNPGAPPAARAACFVKNLRVSHRRGAHWLNHLWLRHVCRLRTPDRKLVPRRLVPAVADPVEQMIRVLEGLPAGVSEIAFHPGYGDLADDDSPEMAERRRQDLAVATDPRVADAVQRHGIERIHFGDLPRRREK